MKIAIDVSQIIYETGVSVYTENLIKNLSKIDSENKYILFGGSLRRLNDLRVKTKDIEGIKKFYPIPPIAANFIWNKLHVLPIEWLVGKIDVFHSSDWTQPPTSSFKVTTIHDLSPIIFPGSAKKDALRNIPSTHMARLDWVKKEVDRIIVPSLATKKDLIELQFEEKKIRVIPEAASEEFRPRSSEEVNETKRKYQIRGDYIISVGVGGRKNTDKLISAYERAKVGKDFSLVLVGAGSEKFENQRGIKTLGHINENELAALYSGARALIYPSLYEGFGLPILQAFACKCPVVTSNISSMPEVAGDAAVLVDPHDVSSIADGIGTALKESNELIKRGVIRAKDFSWEKTAIETLKVYLETRG